MGSGLWGGGVEWVLVCDAVTHTYWGRIRQGYIRAQLICLLHVSTRQCSQLQAQATRWVTLQLTATLGT
jgi:hypothetical protein